MEKIKICPHCGQSMMIYRRTIRANMLECLFKLFEKYGYQEKKVHDIEPDGILSADFEKLRYWNLIESGKNVNTWKITEHGVDFLSGTINVKKFVFIYNKVRQNDPPDEINPWIFAKDIIPDTFDQRRFLMSERYFSPSGQDQLKFI